MARKLIFLFLVHVWLEGSLAQHSPYSLQAAVDALHRREAQLALKDNYNVPPRYGIPATAQEQDYWDDDFEAGPPAFVTPAQSNNRHKLNRILASYLAREEDNARNGGGIGVPAGYELDDDNYLPEEKKRSFFRERDGKDEPSASLFRERDNQPYDNSELTDQFLKEIEEARQIDREERYKDALRRIWEKYQQQDNEIDNDPFEEQKRMASQPNYYVGPLMQKKRTYPVLPWLPMSRRKRFPVAKRSPKMPFDDASKVNNEKVPDELRELFGKPGDDKKKRSTDDQSTDVPVEKKNEKNDTATTEPEAEHPPHGGHHHKERKHRKRSDHSHESQEEEEEDSEEHEPEHEEHEEHEEEEDDEEHEHDDFEDEDEAQKKKKREADDKHKQKRSNLEVVKEDQIIPGDMATAHRRKKSIQWNKYFGIDRRKKSTYDSADAKKRVPTEEEDEEEEKRKKKNIDPEKLNNMGKKLQSIEDLIIDETVKYTGAHEGIADPDEIARLKDHVVSRLATAYSLEKMRRALEKLRQSVDNENHLLRNVVESESKSDDDSDIENQKRLSVKKEKVEFQGLHHSINTPHNEKSKDVQGNAMTSDDTDNDDEDKKKKKQKKRNGYQRYPDVPNDVSEFEEELGAGHYEPLNDAYLGNKNYIPGASQCPLIDTMAERCRGVDLLSGDINQELLPICGVHQICYLCGTSQVACDFQYLAEADSICGHNNECQSAARSVLMILRGSPGPQLGPKECLKNPCLNRAMREIGL